MRLGYTNILCTGQFTKYCAKWRKRKPDMQTSKEFRIAFTEYNKERTDTMTTKEGFYTMNQVHELIQAGIQNEKAAWCQPVQDENENPNLPPPLPQTSLFANILSDIDLAKLAQLLKPTLTPKQPLPPPNLHWHRSRGRFQGSFNHLLF